MSAVKNEAIKLIKKMPEDTTVDDIFSELFFKLQVDAGLKQLDQGKGLTHEEVKQRMKKWLSR